jgi:serine/threonine protein kinase/tetratricopeptide (TPR) repeat protein
VSSDDHARVKELFLAACEQPPEKRLAFLDAECGEDDALLAEVAELLDFHEEETTREELATASLLEDLESIANYRVLQKVGEGGMGEVYEAEQTKPVRRRVALKVIKWGMDTKEVLARFESERQALALMNHPNIARVFEAGTTDSGRPYFAMEYVKGVPITEYCDTHRLSTDERLNLFIEVCEGVQHAHQRGVIHRDMKPSNVLVTIRDDKAVPKIIDFGVAKATSQRLTERTVFTELGQWIGTPEYMSPEQAEMTGLDIDTRTDVYSLGVVLYELLVGAQPFDSTTLRKAGFDEMRRRIREDEPQRPSTRVSSLGGDSEVAAQRRRTNPANLARELKGDLDWIVMKALEKDRTRRYSTPMDLSEDVRRHLRNEAVVASPPSAVYRLGKFVRRNRVAVAAALLVIAALILGIVGTSVGLVQARREADASRQVVRLVSGILGGMDPGSAYGHAQSIDEVLDRGVARIDRELVGQPLVRAPLKSIVGRVYLGLGELDRSGPLLAEALELRLSELDENHPEVAESLNSLGNQQLNIGHFQEAHDLFARAVTAYEATLGPDHIAFGMALNNLGFAQERLGQYDRALTSLDRARAIAERADGPDSLSAAGVIFNQGILYRDLGKTERSIELSRRCLEIRERQLGPDHTGVGWAAFVLGLDHEFLGDRETASRLQERALAIQEAALGDHSYAVSLPLWRLAVLRSAEGDYEEARRLLDRVLEIHRGPLGGDHPDFVPILRSHAYLLRREGDVAAAGRAHLEELALAERVYGAEHAEYAMALYGTAHHEYSVGNLDEAWRIWEQCRDVLERALGPRAKRLGSTYYSFACLAAIQERRDVALEMLGRALDCDGWVWRGILEDSDLDSLRGDPEFEALMDEVRRRVEKRAAVLAAVAQ